MGKLKELASSFHFKPKVKEKVKALEKQTSEEKNRSKVKFVNFLKERKRESEKSMTKEWYFKYERDK